jgi:beta-galactosidase
MKFKTKPITIGFGWLEWAAILAVFLLLNPQAGADETPSVLPAGVKAVWDIDQAQRDSTPSREQICLNGLWRWQPAAATTGEPPSAEWGFFKVPGSWPRITDYMQKDSQTLYPHPRWAGVKPGGVTSAWYEREFNVPENWIGRRISLRLEYLNSFAVVFVDGVKTGELRFPGGDLDVSSACRPGANHRVSLLVTALPLKGVMLSYTDSASAREVKGTVARKGLCGDVFLVSTPRGPTIQHIAIGTSVRRQELTIDAELAGLEPTLRYTLRTSILKSDSKVKEFTSTPFQKGDLKEGWLRVTENWVPNDLWDLNTPQNQFAAQVSVISPDGQALDTDWKRPFAFREFWINGRDFYLNGKRIFLSAVPLDNAQLGAGLATYEATRECLDRLKSFGINYVYTHNYDCEPGSHLSFTEILRAADDAGMLVGFTQPHFSHYDWKSPDADLTNNYARHAAYYTGAAGNHPSVVMYVMSHNATGYEEDMNPDMIDGIHDGRDQWALRNVKMAERAEAIVRHLDPGRIVYHHASGNLGVMYDSNFYPNFAPVQELDDWFEHWATAGVKPAFTCEYGAPFTWDWTMYRGWYKGQREWGSAKVPWEFCLAEWNAQFLGDSAFKISEAEKANLRWEAAQFRAGNTWHRWDYPNPVGSDRFTERYPVFAKYITDNWRAYRTWGVSGISPWEYEHFWKLRPGVDRSRKNLPVDWDHLQQPGFSPDYIGQRYERMDTAFKRSDWIATPAAQALIRNNQPLLAWIAGKPTAFTSKDHNFRPGDLLEKQIVLINNSRENATCDSTWTLKLRQPISGTQHTTIPVGDQARIPMRLELPKSLPAGSYALNLVAKFGTGETQEDSFIVDIMPPVRRFDGESSPPKIALFDPRGETTGLLKDLGIVAQPIAADGDTSMYDVLVIGKAALTLEGAAPNISRVREGLKVVIFEQTAEVLEQRFGFRVQEYGLRQLFQRIPDHPILDGTKPEHLRDWRGSATILSPRLKYDLRPRYGPVIQRAGLPQTRVWRCGNRGNVASVLIEKPARGDFLPILDGGFSLQYTPLLEYREGKGIVLFCQVDVTARTESDPVAEILVRNLLRYAGQWKPAGHRSAVYAGGSDGKAFLESLGMVLRPFDAGRLEADQLLVLGPGAADEIGTDATSLNDFVKNHGNILAIGLDESEIARVLPLPVKTKSSEHISSYFKPFGMKSVFAGIGPADVHNRDPRKFPLISSGAEIAGDGIFAKANGAEVVFVQMTPWQFSNNQQGTRRTFRRSAAMLNQVVANLGAAGSTTILERLSKPVDPSKKEQRWLNGFYLDQPEEWDDPYRFFRW